MPGPPVACAKPGAAARGQELTLALPGCPAPGALPAPLDIMAAIGCGKGGAFASMGMSDMIPRRARRPVSPPGPAEILAHRNTICVGACLVTNQGNPEDSSDDEVAECKASETEPPTAVGETSERPSQDIPVPAPRARCAAAFSDPSWGGYMPGSAGGVSTAGGPLPAPSSGASAPHDATPGSFGRARVGATPPEAWAAMKAAPTPDIMHRLDQLAVALEVSEAARVAAVLELERARQHRGGGATAVQRAQSRPPAAATGPNSMRMSDQKLRDLFHSGFACLACNKPAFPDVHWCNQCRRPFRHIIYVGPDYYHHSQIPTRAGGTWGDDADWTVWALAWGYPAADGEEENEGGSSSSRAWGGSWGSGWGGEDWQGWSSRWRGW